MKITNKKKKNEKTTKRETIYFADCLTGGEGSLPRSENGCWAEDVGKSGLSSPVRVSSEWHRPSSGWAEPCEEELERSEE